MMLVWFGLVIFGKITCVRSKFDVLYLATILKESIENYKRWLFSLLNMLTTFTVKGKLEVFERAFQTGIYSSHREKACKSMLSWFFTRF